MSKKYLKIVQKSRLRAMSNQSNLLKKKVWTDIQIKLSYLYRRKHRKHQNLILQQDQLTNQVTNQTSELTIPIPKKYDEKVNCLMDVSPKVIKMLKKLRTDTNKRDSRNLRIVS